MPTTLNLPTTPFGPNPLHTLDPATRTLTVDYWLRPGTPYIQKTLESLTYHRFIGDFLLGRGPATDTGAVIYDQLLSNGPFFTSRDVAMIEPGADFPLVEGYETMPIAGVTQKWGSRVEVYEEDRRRNRTDKLARKLLQLRNTMVKKSDTIVMATFDGAVTNSLIPTQDASDTWDTDTSSVVEYDIRAAQRDQDKLEMGYVYDTIVLSPDDLFLIVTNAKIQSRLPRENMQQSMMLNPDLTGLFGVRNWVSSPRKAAGSAYLLQRQAVGFISDEVPLTTLVKPDPPIKDEIYVWRQFLAAITDPMAAVLIDGISEGS